MSSSARGVSLDLSPLGRFFSQSIALDAILLLAGITIIIITAVVVWRILSLARRIEVANDEADRQGMRLSAAAGGPNPLTSFSRFGTLGDPLNLKVIGNADQIITAFSAAGWYRADRIRLLSSVRLGTAALLNLRYATAPVSNLYLYGRKQDYTFQKPGPSVRVRDHVRFWDTGERDKHNRPIWIGSATRDTAVNISPRTRLITHKIAPDVDTERALVGADLIATGWVVKRQWERRFGHPVQMVNAMGYPFYTDGRMVTLTLADVPVLLPLTTSLRGRLAASLIAGVAGAFRWTLPRAGRLLAKQQHADVAPDTDTDDVDPIAAN
jgi:hypothetical protein